MVAPAMVGPAAVLANPRELPVATTARPEAGFSARPLDLTVLTDGTVATVDDMQVGLCFEAHCASVGLMSMPCLDGEQPKPIGESGRSCQIEAPLKAADITPDGTLLALTRGRGNAARFFWCRIDHDAPDGQCRWGGAIVLHQQPARWENGSMDVTAVAGGGFAAVILTPGPDEVSGTLLLVTCEHLDCPQPTVRRVSDVPLPGGWQGGGSVAIAADPHSGNLALGYFDPTDGSLLLGGCPAGCADGPVMNPAGAWPQYDAQAHPPSLPSLDLVATSTGPVAVLA
jgi:hypothetical protein